MIPRVCVSSRVCEPHIIAKATENKSEVVAMRCVDGRIKYVVTGTVDDEVRAGCNKAVLQNDGLDGVLDEWINNAMKCEDVS